MEIYLLPSPYHHHHHFCTNPDSFQRTLSMSPHPLLPCLGAFAHAWLGPIDGIAQRFLSRLWNLQKSWWGLGCVRRNSWVQRGKESLIGTWKRQTEGEDVRYWFNWNCHVPAWNWDRLIIASVWIYEMIPTIWGGCRKWMLAQKGKKLRLKDLAEDTTWHGLSGKLKLKFFRLSFYLWIQCSTEMLSLMLMKKNKEENWIGQTKGRERREIFSCSSMGIKRTLLPYR